MDIEAKVVRVKGYYLDKEWLRKEYLDYRLSCREIAKLLRCSKMTVSRLLRIFAIPSRPFEYYGKKWKMTREEAYEIFSDDFPWVSEEQQERF